MTCLAVHARGAQDCPMTTAYDFSAPSIEGKDTDLGEYAGKVLLIVNVASKCGLTPHYEGLEALHKELASEGLRVLGFPCNQFGAQEPGDEDEIRAFCTTNYGVDFPMFSKLDVNGAGRHPLYAWLTEQSAGPDEAGDIKWNFAKFVVGRDGAVVARFSPMTEPGDRALRAAIVGALAAG